MSLTWQVKLEMGNATALGFLDFMRRQNGNLRAEQWEGHYV